MTEGTVSATAFGPWPGLDIAEACQVLQGELGAPHLPILPLLPARGAASQAIGRTAAVLVELPVDVQSYGWRLVQRPGADLRRAQSSLSSDINILADVVGGLASKLPRIKTQLMGPFSLAANLHLPLGEKVLADHGARRELVQSLAAGVTLHLKALQAAAPGGAVSLQLDEPEIEAILAGRVPTVSGYKTMRAVPVAEMRAAWDLVIEAARAAGAAEVILSVPFESAALAAESTADGVAFSDVAGVELSGSKWESIASLVEAGTSVLLPVPRGKAGRAAEAIWRPWRGVGLPAQQMGALRLFEAADLTEVSPAAAQKVLGELTDVIDAIQELIASA